MSSKVETIYDKRIIQRQIKRGKVAKKDYEQFLASLEDATKKAVPLFHDEEPPAKEREP